MTVEDTRNLVAAGVRITALEDALREVIRRAEGANARAQWVAEPAKAALDEDRHD